MKLDWELIGIILLFLIMALAGASQANTFYNPKPRDFASIYNMKFTNWQFQVSDNDSFLALQPAMTVAGVKYKINATTPNLNQFNSSVINKTTSYKFSFNISVSAIVRSNVNNFSLDIVGNTGKIDFDNKLHELYMDDLIINFDDLIDAGFLVTINETNVVISNITGKQFNFDPTVNFTSQSVKGIDLTPLNDTAFVAGFCYTGQRMFSIISTDGTIINNSISAGGGALSGNCVSYDDIHVATLSTSLFATVVYNYNNDNEYLTFYNASAGNMTVALIYAKSVNSFYTGITALNSTDVMACNKDLSAGKLNCSQYHYNGYGVVPTKISGYTTVNYGSVGAGTTPIDPKAFNSTTYVACYVDYTGTEVNFTILTASGTILVNPVQVDSNLLQVGYVRCSALDDHTFVIGYYDATLKQYKSAVYYSNGTKRSGNTVVDDTGTSTTRTLGVAGFNATTYAYGDFNTTLYRFSIWNADNALLIANQTVSTVSGGSAMAVTSREFAPNIRFCSANDTVNQYLVVAYVYSTTQSNFTTYYPNGTIWNGVCPSGGQPPVCTDNSFSVVWNGPLNNTWNQSQTITHSYTPTWGCSAVMANCSLWTNKTGAFALAGSNATPLTNNSINTISFNYAVDSPNIWAYINCTNTSGTSNFTSNNTIKIDTANPSTTATAVKNDSSAYTFNTWTASSYVNVSLSCVDSTSGCASTKYCADATDTCTPSTAGTAVQISTAGTSYIRYNSTDNAGNNEAVQSQTIKIDTTTPSTPTITNQSNGDAWINLTIGACTDSGSGVLKKLLYRNGINVANLTSETGYNDTGLTNCTQYAYLLGCLDNVGWYGSNSTQLLANTTGCYVPPPTDRSPPIVNLTSPLDGSVNGDGNLNFQCNATSNNTLANVSLYGNFTGSWLLNSTQNTSGSSNSATFPLTLGNGSYFWNCQWCNTFNNCSFAVANWTVNVSIVPVSGGGMVFLTDEDVMDNWLSVEYIFILVALAIIGCGIIVDDKFMVVFGGLLMVVAGFMFYSRGFPLATLTGKNMTQTNSYSAGYVSSLTDTVNYTRTYWKDAGTTNISYILMFIALFIIIAGIASLANPNHKESEEEI